jgi:DNA-binding IclR family transcriptional regulator
MSTLKTHPEAEQPGRDPATLEPAALSRHPSFASTLANGLAVLGCFSGAQPSLGNKDIADQLGLSKPTISRLTFTLVALGYLRREKQTGKYQLGPAVLSLGYPLLSQLTIRQVAAADMLDLARLAHGPVSVGARDRLQVVYVETTLGSETNATKPGVGSTRPMLRTAMGRAIMHAHPEGERGLLEKRLRQAMPQEWEAYAPGLERAYTDIQERGFCTVAGEWRPTLAAVAVPMKAPLHGLHLAFSVTVPSYSAEAAKLQDSIGPRLVELVRRVEATLAL